MDKNILKQLVRGALEGSAFPLLNKEETEVYLNYLGAHRVIAKATYWNRNGREVLARIIITHRSPEIDAEIDQILKG
jgi:hypothetical protein